MKSFGLLFTLSLLAAACGGKVTVDTESAVPSPATCKTACEKSETACMVPMDTPCVTSCQQTEQILAPHCPDEWDGWLRCLFENPTFQCNGSTACNAEMNALVTCFAEACADPANCQ